MHAWVAPPEFGPDGSPPPAVSEAWQADEEYIVTSHDNPDRGYDVGKLLLTPYKLHTSAFYGTSSALANQLSKLTPRRVGARQIERLVGQRIRGVPLLGYGRAVEREKMVARFNLQYPQITGMRRFRVANAWERNDLIQLPPGGTTKVTDKNIVGISSTAARELGASLGLEGGVADVLKLSGTLSEKLSRSVTLTGQREVSHELTLANANPDQYRRYSLWHVATEIQIDDLRVANSSLGWHPLRKVRFGSDDSAPVVTYFDIRPARIT